MCRACSAHEKNEKYTQILVRKLKGKRPLGRQKCSWMDTIKMNIKEIGWECVHRI